LQLAAVSSTARPFCHMVNPRHLWFNSECNLQLGIPHRPPLLHSPFHNTTPPSPLLPLLLPLLLHLVPGDSRSMGIRTRRRRSKSGRHYPSGRRGLGAHGRRGRNKGADTGQGSSCPIGRVLKRGNGRGNGHWSRCGGSTAAYADGSTGKIEANYAVNDVSLCYAKGYKRYTYNPQQQVQPLSAEPIGRLFCYMYVSNCNNLSDFFRGFRCYKRSYIHGTYRAVLGEMMLVVGFEKPATSGASSHK
jgi:hypothetical protein